MKKILFIVLITVVFMGCKTSKKAIISTKKPTEIHQKEKLHYWQQHVSYFMDIDMDTQKHQYLGKQKLVYTNNSPDTLYNVYYHLYWNAFQPGSAMDWRARTIEDPDRNLDTKIKNLKTDEIGFIKINSLTQDEVSINYKTVGTILEVKLNKPIPPHTSTTFNMDFLTQIPIILRRGGRNNSEGIDYSMAQWYPKLAEYDASGWHADPYIGREFYGVWGDFDVKIHIDKKYTIASTGYLQNPEEIGKGYTNDKNVKPQKGNKLIWHFYAPNVHDFSWAADPDYKHDILTREDGVKLHFFYQNEKQTAENFKKIQEIANKTMTLYNQLVGKYPYKKYNYIQAGDGGMEYGMGTFINGKKPFSSFRGTVQHEMGHAWFQFTIATNESAYPWMDEGFTSYIQDLANVNVNGNQATNPFTNSYDSYQYLVQQQKDEPLNTHSDHYNTNIAYWIGAYDKGKLTLTQLGYIVGFKNLNNALKEYYKKWAMKHPQPKDFFHCVEKQTHINVKWFQNDWLNTTHHIDYGIKSVLENGDKTVVTLQQIGEMPMPLDIFIIYKDGTKEMIYIPLDLMRGIKKNDFYINRSILEEWQYGIPEYSFYISKNKNEISVIVIDALGFMADINPENNAYLAKELKEKKKE